MTITKEQLDELERKAKAATGGEWAADRVAGMPRDDDPILASVICLDIGDDSRQQQIADCYDNTRCTDRQCAANASHIAANSPDVTLQLVAVYRAALAWNDARKRIAPAREALDDLGTRTARRNLDDAFDDLDHCQTVLDVALRGTP